MFWMYSESPNLRWNLSNNLSSNLYLADMHVWRVLFCLVLCFLFVSQSFCEEEYFLCLQILQREKCESKNCCSSRKVWAEDGLWPAGRRSEGTQVGPGSPVSTEHWTRLIKNSGSHEIFTCLITYITVWIHHRILQSLLLLKAVDRHYMAQT